MEGGRYGISFKVFLRKVNDILEDDPEVVRLIEKRHKKASDDYRNSREFAWLMAETARKMQDDVSEKYVHLKDIIRELKAYDAKKPTKVFSEENFTKMMTKLKAEKEAAKLKAEKGAEVVKHKSKTDKPCSTLSDSESCLDEGGESSNSRSADCDIVHREKGQGQSNLTKGGNGGKKKKAKLVETVTEESEKRKDRKDTYQNGKGEKEGKQHRNGSKVSEGSGKIGDISSGSGEEVSASPGREGSPKGGKEKLGSSIQTSKGPDKMMTEEVTEDVTGPDVIDTETEDKSEQDDVAEKAGREEKLARMLATDSAPLAVVEDMVPLDVETDEDEVMMVDEDSQTDYKAALENFKKAAKKGSSADDQVRDGEQAEKATAEGTQEEPVEIETDSEMVEEKRSAETPPMQEETSDNDVESPEGQGDIEKQTNSAKCGNEDSEVEMVEEDASVDAALEAFKKAGESAEDIHMEETVMVETDPPEEASITETAKSSKDKKTVCAADVEVVVLEEEEEEEFQTTLDDLESAKGSDLGSVKGSERCESVESAVQPAVTSEGEPIRVQSVSPDEKEEEFQTELEGLDENSEPPDKSAKPNEETASSVAEVAPSSPSKPLVIASVTGNGSPSKLARSVPMEVEIDPEEPEEPVTQGYSEFTMIDTVLMDESSQLTTGKGDRDQSRAGSEGPGAAGPQGSEMQADVMTVDEDAEAALSTLRSDKAAASGDMSGTGQDSEELPEMPARPSSQTSSEFATISTASHTTGSPLVVADIISVDEELMQGSPASVSSKTSLPDVKRQRCTPSAKRHYERESTPSSRDSSPLIDVSGKRKKRPLEDENIEPDFKKQRKEPDEINDSSVMSEPDKDGMETSEESEKKKFNADRLSLKSKKGIAKCDVGSEESTQDTVECKVGTGVRVLGSGTLVSKLDTLISGLTTTALQKDKHKEKSKERSLSPKPESEPSDPKPSTSGLTKSELRTVKEGSQSPKPEIGTSEPKSSTSEDAKSRSSSEKEVPQSTSKLKEKSDEKKAKRSTTTFLGKSEKREGSRERECDETGSVASMASGVTEASGTGTSISTEDEEEIRARTKRERQIKRLESLLKRLSDEIQNLQRRELTLDEMKAEDSVYELEDRYKKRIMKVWNKLCELQGASKTTGRIKEKKFKFEGTRYPDINRKVERFINRQGQFPDYHDITLIVGHCNRKFKMGLPKKRIETLARDIFTQVGNTLQQRRMDDFTNTFGSHLTDRFKSYNDPALFDKELSKKLDSNKQQGRHRLEEVINKYVEKQEQRPSEESSSSSSEDEEEEKDNGNKSEEDDEVVVEMTLMEDEETTTMETDLPLAWREPKPEPKEDEVEKQSELPVEETKVGESAVDEGPAQVEEEEMEEEEEESDGSDSDLIIESDNEDDNGDGGTPQPVVKEPKEEKEEKEDTVGDVAASKKDQPEVTPKPVNVEVKLFQSEGFLEMLARKAVHRLGISKDADTTEGSAGGETSSKGSRNVAKKSGGKPAKGHTEGTQLQAMGMLGLMPTADQESQGQKESEVKDTEVEDQSQEKEGASVEGEVSSAVEAEVAEKEKEKENVVEEGTDKVKATDDKVTEDKDKEKAEDPEVKDTEEFKDTESQGGKSTGWEIDLPSPGSGEADEVTDKCDTPVPINVVPVSTNSPVPTPAMPTPAVPTLRAEDIPADLIVSSRGSPVMVQDIVVIDEDQNGNGNGKSAAPTTPPPTTTPMVYIDCDESTDSQLEPSHLPSRTDSSLPLRISSVTSLEPGSPIRFNIPPPQATSTPKLLGSGRVVKPSAAPVVSTAATPPKVISWPKGLDSMESAQQMMQMVGGRVPSSSASTLPTTSTAPRAAPAPDFKALMTSPPRMPRASVPRMTTSSQMAAISAMMRAARPRGPQAQPINLGSMVGNRQLTPQQMVALASMFGRRGSQANFPQFPSPQQTVSPGNQSRYLKQLQKRSPGKPMSSGMMMSNKLRTFASAMRNTRRANPVASSNRQSSNGPIPNAAESIVPSSGKPVELDSDTHVIVGRVAPNSPSAEVIEIDDDTSPVDAQRKQRRRERMQQKNQELAIRQFAAAGQKHRSEEIAIQRFAAAGMRQMGPMNAAMALMQMQMRANRRGGPRMMTPRLPILPIPSSTPAAVTMTTTTATQSSSSQDTPNLTISSYQSLATGMVVERRYKPKKAPTQHRKEPKRTSGDKSAECIVLSDSE